MTGRTLLAPRPALAMLALAVLVAPTLGCMSLKRPAPNKELFLLETKRADEDTPASAAGAAHVKALGVSPAFAGKAFVYRLDEHAYTTDFYSEFLIPPGEQIDAALRGWLAAAGLIAPLAPRTRAEATTQFAVAYHVQRLHADFRNRENPTAVVEIKVFLSRETSGEFLLQKTYARAEPLEERKPAAIVAGWDRALTSILEDLETDLATAMRKAARP